MEKEVSLRCGSLGRVGEEGRNLNKETFIRPEIFSWAGIRIVEAAEGRSRLELQVEDHHRGGAGTNAINGGIVAYLFDGLLGMAVRSVWTEDVVRHATISLNIQYQRLVNVKETLVGCGHVTKAGGTTVFAVGEVYDDWGLVAASCTGIYRLFRRPVRSPDSQ
ncbi:MAG: hypothetical protein C7B45_03685 [Sulfobacillus acidophilus]|uniref:Thioesterase domain-containing protein n=1 Tax=Sulfobacillus acidophilus TaxID=53633 RepID=A0A2T2WLU4_9FIRM|nr:MAG: hypothetical protein C7B45_03685 [Sulfobacillus acidophilus]